MAMKPGRFWFSVPRPYVTHDPTLGRAIWASPQFISISDGSWLGTSAFIDRMTHKSSAWRAMLGNRSLTGSPLWPYFRNLKGEGKAAPVLRSVGRLPVGSGLSAYFSSSGLGSKLSTWEGPPLRKKWITRLALAGNIGGLGASGLTAAAAPAAASAA